LNRIFEINGHMRVPKEFPKDYPKEMQGLHEFVAEMRHLILINRLPPTDLGDKLIANGQNLVQRGYQMLPPTNG
jgi:hypothetical protein